MSSAAKCRVLTVATRNDAEESERLGRCSASAVTTLTLSFSHANLQGSETEWVAQLCAARSDRDAAELERAGLERDLQAALERLAAKEAEVEEARVSG